MTWSIIAHDTERDVFGVAVTSFFFAVGAIIPHIRPGVGAVATQAMVNQEFGPQGLGHLAEGRSPEETIAALADSDPGRTVRQIHLIDAGGASAAHTGTRCPDWAGHRSRTGVSVAGNTLAGPQVAERTLEAFLERNDLPFERRLVAALSAGETVGGDRRGRQSAALLVRGRPGAPDIDLRVDDHPEPIVELDRLLSVYETDFMPIGRLLPRLDGYSGIHDAEAVQVARAERMSGHASGRSPSRAIVKD